MNILLNKTVVYFFGWLIHHESRNMKILINVFHIWFYIFGNKSSNDNMSNDKNYENKCLPSHLYDAAVPTFNSQQYFSWSHLKDHMVCAHFVHPEVRS